uniref:PD-(D/E)XK nuclease superfamily protein n=1 Tax=viral metagenome TaxID=1070528 RepID=A0A6M3JI73_9ZZZZ
MKIKEIKASISGVIPIASYENLKPYYEISAELEEGDNIADKIKELRDIVRWHFDQEGNRAKADVIEKQYAGIRFYEKDGRKYPSVTSILGWDIDWKISEDELRQYGSRGTIVHKLIEIYLKEGSWANPLEIPELENDVATLLGGSKKLSWVDCSYKAAVEGLMGDLKVIQLENELYNDENLYAGRADLVCLYKGKQTIMDFKSGTVTDMRQLAAYSACVEGIEQLVIVPVGQTDNKSGVKKPIVSTDIAGEYKKFLYARAKFRERFGI